MRKYNLAHPGVIVETPMWFRQPKITRWRRYIILLNVCLIFIVLIQKTILPSPLNFRNYLPNSNEDDVFEFRQYGVNTTPSLLPLKYSTNDDGKDASINISQDVSLENKEPEIATGQEKKPETEQDSPGEENKQDTEMAQTGEENRSTNEGRIIKILYWTAYWGHWEWYFGYGRQPFIDTKCPVDMCETTRNLEEYNSSDVIMVHINEIKTPAELPTYRLPHHKWVFFNNEPPYLTRANLSLFHGYFNMTMSYRLDSGASNPYGKILPLSADEKQEYQHRNYAEGRTKLAAWFVSNCAAPSGRDWLVKEMQKYTQIDVYGKCGPLECTTGCHQMLSRDYKFYLALENSLCYDYITEKLWFALKVDVVPVVMGGANYSNTLPPKSFIDVKDFSSPKALASYLMLLHSNDTLYNEYFEWRKDTRPLFPNTHTMCDLCAYLHKMDGQTTTFEDINNWYNGTDTCRKAHDVYGHIEGFPTSLP